MLTAHAAVPRKHTIARTHTYSSMHGYSDKHLYKAHGAGVCMSNRKAAAFLIKMSDAPTTPLMQFLPCSCRPEVSLVFHGNNIKLPKPLYRINSKCCQCVLSILYVNTLRPLLEIALYRLGGPELAYNKNIITIQTIATRTYGSPRHPLRLTIW